MSEVNDVNKLAEQYGVEGIDESLTTKNEGSPFYTHQVGQYQAVVGQFEVIYFNKEDEKCSKDTPGARPAYGLLRFIIFQDPEKRLIDEQFKLENERYIRFVYTQYVPLEKDKQWQNARFFAEFTFSNVPKLNVVQGERNKENIFLSHLNAYYGIPVKFELKAGKKKPETSRFIDSPQLTILDHELSKEKMEKRKKTMGALESKLEEKKYSEQKKSQDEDPSNDQDKQPEEPDALLDDFGFDN